MSRVYNFSAGPAMLPVEVLKEAASEMLDYQGSGMSVMEMMMSTKAINYDGMPHGSGGQGDLSGEVARIQGLIDELKRERGLRIMTYQDIARRIKKLRSRNEDDVLFYRYIKGMEWYEIAETMSYSERQIHRIHGTALAHLELPEKDVSECQ